MTTTYLKDTLLGLISNSKGLEYGFEKITNSQLIQMADYIQDIFKNQDMLNPPNICVIGTQSSGKSITLNSLIGLDILPNGKSIVTRTPVHLRLIHTEKEKNIVIEFYCRHDSTKIISSFTMNAQTQSDEELGAIRKEIERLTDDYAGSNKNVVDCPINIKIRSPNVPNLSITDLPGITNIALTDKGQPINIKENIDTMLSTYIKNPRTIILAIIPAIIDAESDMGLGLIKKFDPEFSRTIGVITKVDMLKDHDVNCYLEGNISKNLKLHYGYYAVRNRSSEEIKTQSVRDGFETEKKFFVEHPIYKVSKHRDRMGALNLGNKLSEILITHLRKCLPAVIEEIKIIDAQLESELSEIGRDYPTDDISKRSMLNVIINDFQKIFISSIKDRGAQYNTGALLAHAYVKFKTQIDNLKPFDKGIYSDKIITDIIMDYEGNHMPTPTISAGIIEKCFQITDMSDKIDKMDPIQTMREPFINLIKDVQTILIDLVDKILERDKFNRFPKLCSKLKELIVSSIIPSRYEFTVGKVNDVFIMEKECIWTDDAKFRTEILSSMFYKTKENSIDPNIIRTVLNGYFNVTREHVKHTIHKEVQVFFVNKILEDISTKLIDYIYNKADINQMLEENKEKAIRRETILNKKTKIEMAKKMIQMNV